MRVSLLLPNYQLVVVLPVVSLGKHVFKKAVKLIVSVSPTQSVSSQGSSSSKISGGNSSGDQSSSSLVDSIVFDGRTFTVTFSHVSGKSHDCMCACGLGLTCSL